MEAAWPLVDKALELPEYHLYSISESKSRGQVEIQEEGN